VRVVEAPAEFADLHEEMVRSLADVVAAVETFAGRIGDVESEAHLEALFEGFQLDEPTARFERACLRLEGVALANGIEVNLECEDE